MPRIRTIKPKFWDDIKLSKVSRDARLTFIGMWNFSDDAGVIIGEPTWIKSKIFPFDPIQLQQFERWLTELEKSGFISLFSYKNEKFYYLPNFTRHQVINRPNNEELNVPNIELQRLLANSLNDHGLISEQSQVEGKGMEGKGEEAQVPPPTPDELEFDEVQVWLKENAPKLLKMKEPLNLKQYQKLKAQFDPEFISKQLLAMHNWGNLLKRESAYLTFLKFAEKEKQAA